jgi:hypothetical protein
MPENPSVRLQPEGVGTHYAPGDGLDYVRQETRRSDGGGRGDQTV